MSDLQHARIAELCAELRLSAVPELYGALAQAAVAKDVPYAGFLEEVLRASGMCGGRGRVRCSRGWRASRR